MLATPKLHERLLLALEAITNVFGYQQAAIAIVNERTGDLRIRAAVGFDGTRRQPGLRCRWTQALRVFASSTMLIRCGFRCMTTKRRDV